jgi:hypothetical protein
VPTVSHSLLNGTQRSTAPGRSILFVPALVVVLFLSVAGARDAQAAIEGDTVVLQGLDKVTARVWSFDVRIGDTVRFGTLEIQPRFCERTPPEEPPESKAFMDIYEVREGEERSDLFHGWMFASSPALNALEHPVYDVWLLDCKTTETAPPPADATGAPDGPETPQAPR